MRPVVFAGPSLYGVQLNGFADIDFRGPAVCGDILKSVAEGRKTIGLIDGGFEHGPAAWHKEILEAIQLGCAVFGASSMGALRAAELHNFGMIGLGQIYSEYASGQRSSDADVAVIHGPGELGYPPLNLSLVEMEDSVFRLCASRAICSETAKRLLQAGKSMFFKDRTWEEVLSEALDDDGFRQSLRSLIDGLGTGVKTRDAELLLKTVSSAKPHPTTPSVYKRTTFMRALIEKLDISL